MDKLLRRLQGFNAYEVLDVPRDATSADIKRAYKIKSRAVHPDAGGFSGFFDVLTAAQDVLANHRGQYDKFLAAGSYTEDREQDRDRPPPKPTPDPWDDEEVAESAGPSQERSRARRPEDWVSEEERLKQIRDLAERRRRVRAAEEQARQQDIVNQYVRRRLTLHSSRRATDWFIATVAVGACVTILVPWLIGRFMLRDAFWRPVGPEVFDTSLRSNGDYFLSDWQAGCCVVLGLAVLLLVLRPWIGRFRTAIVGITIAGFAIVVLGSSSAAAWYRNEAAVAATLRHTSYPFDEKFFTCGSAEYRVNGTPWVLYSGQRSGSTISGCNRLELYAGWSRRVVIDMPSSRFIPSGRKNTIRLTAADQRPASASFTVTLRGQRECRISLAPFLTQEWPPTRGLVFIRSGEAKNPCR